MTDIFVAPICPFAHRAWMALELLKVPYKLIEVDLKAKSQEFLDAYPKAVGASKAPGAPAKVPVIRDATFPDGLAESAIITEYLIGSAQGAGKDFLTSLTPKQRVHSSLVVEQVGGPMIKSFYGLLSAQEPEVQTAATKELLASFAAWGAAQAEASGGAGPFFLGAQPSLADLLLFPWPARLGALSGWRGFTVPDEPQFATFNAWCAAMTALPGVAKTLRDDAFYKDGYSEYANGARKAA